MKTKTIKRIGGALMLLMALFLAGLFVCNLNIGWFMKGTADDLGAIIFWWLTIPLTLVWLVMAVVDLIFGIIFLTGKGSFTAAMVWQIIGTVIYGCGNVPLLSVYFEAAVGLAVICLLGAVLMVANLVVMIVGKKKTKI